MPPDCCRKTPSTAWGHGGRDGGQHSPGGRKSALSSHLLLRTGPDGMATHVAVSPGPTPGALSSLCWPLCSLDLISLVSPGLGVWAVGAAGCSPGPVPHGGFLVSMVARPSPWTSPWREGQAGPNLKIPCPFCSEDREGPMGARHRPASPRPQLQERSAKAAGSWHGPQWHCPALRQVIWRPGLMLPPPALCLKQC